MNGRETGHRTVPHTADLRVEAWAPTREGCIPQAVLGTIDSFLDTSSARPNRTHRCQLVGLSDEDLLAAVLEEILYLLDTENEAPIDVELEPIDTGVDVRLAMCESRSCPRSAPCPRRYRCTSWTSPADQAAGGARSHSTCEDLRGMTGPARRLPFAGIVRIR